VLDAGGPPAEPLLVTLSRADEDHPLKLPGAALPRLALTDAEGRFRFTNVEPGEVQLQARDRFQFTSLTSWWEPFAMTPQAEGEAWVTAGEETELALVVGSPYEDVETGFVSGRLTVNGWPGADWHVRTWGEISRSVTVEQDGSFHMGRLAAGEVTLMITPPGSGLMDGSATDVYSFDLAADDQQFVEIGLQTGSVLGQVLDDRTGAPVAGASVILRSTADDGRWWGRRGGVTASQADGSFLLEPVAEGEYSLMAQAEGYADVGGEPFGVQGRLASGNHVLRLPSPVHVRGHVVLAVADAAPEWIWLTAESEDGNEAAARVDETTGTFTIDDLAPGTWTFTIHAGLDVEFASTTVSILADRPDLVLNFDPVPPEPPAELDEGAVEQLQSLGYLSEDG
jgi:hypothetical protein